MDLLAFGLRGGRLLLLPLHGAFLVIVLAILLVKLVALLDCLTRRDAAFIAAGKQTKQTWLLLTGGALVTSLLGFLTLIGLVVALVYLVDVRPAVRR